MIKDIDTSIRDDKRTIYYQDMYTRHLLRYLAQKEEIFFLPSLSTNIGKTLSRIEELLRELQKLSVDALYISKISRKMKSLEAKYDWHQPVNICLETVSNTTTIPPKPGWMKTAESDILAYSFVWLKGILDTFLYDFRQLRDWFWEEEPKKSKFEWGYWEVPDSPNHTLSRLVPLRDITGVYTQRFITTLDGTVYPVDPRANIKDFCEIQKIPFEPFGTLPNGRTIDGMGMA